jgi:hypothetical protein
VTDKSPFNSSVAHSARIYDYYLGGKDNYEVDRIAGDAVTERLPSARSSAIANRAFMHRTIRWLASQGITQFLDVGSGIPTSPNLHQVAQELQPAARVVYVDNDPLVLAHAQALLTGSPEGRTTYIEADATEPETILGSPQLAETLDLSQPIALSMIGVAHFIPDEQAYDMVRDLTAQLRPGSFLTMSCGTTDLDSGATAAAAQIYRAGGIPASPRTKAEFTRFFTGLELVDPGVTLVHHWRPDDVEPAHIPIYGAVARKA